MEGGKFTEGATTLTQIQALQAAQKAGISLPKDVLARGYGYLERSTRVTAQNADPTKESAGVVYSLLIETKETRVPLTAAAAACLCTAGQFKSTLAVRWVNYCQATVPPDTLRRMPYPEYFHFYYAQTVYVLGEERHAQIRPDLRPHQLLTWSRYRKSLFETLARLQENDGSWKATAVGPVYSTAVYALVLQLDKAILPVFQREAKK
jgi:hypothetical protein